MSNRQSERGWGWCTEWDDDSTPESKTENQHTADQHNGRMYGKPQIHDMRSERWKCKSIPLELPLPAQTFSRSPKGENSRGSPTQSRRSRGDKSAVVAAMKVLWLWNVMGTE